MDSTDTEPPAPTTRSTDQPSLRFRRRLVVIGLATSVAFVVAVTAWNLHGNAPAPTLDANVGVTTTPELGADRGLEIGQVAPDFTLPGLTDGAVKLSDFVGMPVVLNFWASWCAPCRAEFPRLQRVSDDGTAVVVGVSYRDRIKSDLAKFANRQRATWPVAFDAEDIVGRAYKVPSVPTTFFIDAGGVIRHRQFGELTAADLARGVATITPPK